jgi:hypothetical protein
LWTLSTGYRDAGDAALALIRTDTYTGFADLPCVFLYFRSIELALKAVLVYHSIAEHEIARTLGHRISALIVRVETFSPLPDLGILPEDRQLLDRFSDDYSNKWFEYPNDFWRGCPHLEELKNLAHRVCDAVQTYERKKS